MNLLKVWGLKNMIIVQGRVNKEEANNWKFYGSCKDNKNKMWTFYTNSVQQFEQFKKGDKLVGGLKFIKGQANIKGQVVNKLKGEKK